MFAMFPPTRYVRGAALCAHKRDDLYQLLTKLKFRLPACIVWPYYAPSSTVWWFSDHFFLLSVWSPCYTQVHVKWWRKMLQVVINFVVYAVIEHQEIK